MAARREMSKAEADAMLAEAARVRAGGMPRNCVVIAPDFPARPPGPSTAAPPSIADEVAAFAHCAMQVPWGEPNGTLGPTRPRGCATWTEALAAAEAEASARGEGPLRRPTTTAQARAQQREAPDRAVIVISWMPLLREFDAGLFRRAFPSGAYCWNCGRAEGPFLTCGRCRRATYCGAACQTAAWWHHKAAVSSDGAPDPQFGCRR